MPIKSTSRTIAELRARRGKPSQFLVARRLPAKRPPTHPGEMLLEKFLKPLGSASLLLLCDWGVSFPRLNEIIRDKRSVTYDTALRLAHVYSVLSLVLMPL
ncbi:MAG: HigA family addiction module antidote protein [Deltaproteobacteria bacterium]|nr:HigA family addiction module antidote protein [Deltaproteobacteria bacterium]